MPASKAANKLNESQSNYSRPSDWPPCPATTGVTTTIHADVVIINQLRS